MHTAYTYNDHANLIIANMLKLNPEQRDFFKKIADLAFVNPFSEQRIQADCSLLNTVPGTLDLFQRTEKIQTLLEQQLQKLQLTTEFRITHYQGKMLETMKLAWLFFQYYEFQDSFNQFINEQSRAGDDPIELPFAKVLIQRFQQAGFSDPETEKFIALFYQLHRGFYFINSAISGDCPAIIELRMRLWNNIFTFNPHWYLNYLCEKMEDFSTFRTPDLAEIKLIPIYKSSVN